MLENYDDILTVEQLMEILYIGRNTAYKLIKDKEIKCFKIGKSYKIPRQSVTDYIIEKSYGNNSQ